MAFTEERMAYLRIYLTLLRSMTKGLGWRTVASYAWVGGGQGSWGAFDILSCAAGLIDCGSVDSSTGFATDSGPVTRPELFSTCGAGLSALK